MENESNTIKQTRPDWWLTIPNILCAIRFCGAWCLLILAALDRPSLVLGLFLFLTATDWVDGKIAVLLNQRSKIGPKLDTIADVTMYGCLLIAIIVLYTDTLQSEVVLIVLALVSYAVSCMVSWRKFKVMPSYHTRAAKTCWFLALVAVIALFTQWSIWPLRIALVGVMLTNLEAILITRNLTEPRSNIRWLPDSYD
jgi:CDP-diacylglycerol--glycerol-3-phosphate 3-phosphatidyltransferase